LLKNESQLAEGRLRTMQAQLKEAVQKGFIDPKSRAEINILSAKVKENDLQLQYNNALLKKVKVRAPKNGIVLYDESHDWTGQPVSTGQKVMTIAQPSQVEMEIWLPVSDAIQFKEGTEVKLFPEGQPFKVIHGTVIYESYSAELSPKKVLAYRLIASIDPKDLSKVQIGMQGTSKIYGNTVCLIYYLFRRPLTTLRQTFGW